MALAQTLASFLKMIRSIALSLLLLILIVWNFSTLNSSAREIIAMVPRIQQFEASGVKLVLKDEVKLKASLLAATEGQAFDAQKREAIGAVQKLSGAQAERLLTLFPVSSHCDYTLATAKMRLYFNSDAELEQLRLVESVADPDTFEKETASIAAEGGSTIGKPRSCYRLIVTRLGYDAKSALVGVIRQVLH